MKKFLLMFAAAASIAFVGCISETKTTEEVIEESPVIEYTIDGVTADLLNCADEADAIKLLDNIKADAQNMLDSGDWDGYFNIINILRTVWENNKDAILAKIPTLADKIIVYTEVPDSLKAGLNDFVAKSAAEKVGSAADAAVDPAKDAVSHSADAAVDAPAPKRLPPDSITGD